MIRMWQNLLSQMEVYVEEGSRVCNVDELNEFESKTGIILPEDYKTFCQVFGSGEFGSGMSIVCLDRNNAITLEMLKGALEDGFDSELDYRVARGESLDIESLRGLLNSALVFGGDGSTDVVMWDLRTYSIEDKSYDMYMSRIEDFPGACKIGRSFYEFVETFCLGIRSFDHLPNWTHPELQTLHQTFTRVRSQISRSTIAHLPQIG